MIKIPFDPQKPLHVTLRSTRARGDWSMIRGRVKEKIRLLVIKTARESGVRVYGYANVGNHIHLVVLPGKRREFHRFLRVITGAIVFLVTGTRKGNPVGRFWDKLAYTRVVEWGEAFRRLRIYIFKNHLDAQGFDRKRIDQKIRRTFSYSYELLGTGPP